MAHWGCAVGVVCCHLSIFFAGHVPKTCPGAKITSIATINYINQLLFHRPSSIIFQWVYGPQLQRMSRSALEITELLWYQFRYRHCHFQVLEGPKIAIMAVLRGGNRPLSSYLYNSRAHTGIKGLSQEHEGTLTQTELAVVMQIPLSGVSVLPAFGPKIASMVGQKSYPLFSFPFLFLFFSF